ncbi:hypothetical protein EJ04DRAFT_525435 [Polyplosphaeria fusca]|uniref:Uncharacterized protein n=1 Tax=Polyplosphaeria fusca TaxID=682080 RepID=A0A9P4UXM9_9PLEO|nr:hypothetical protein EJ04DRAFT_525435 [Polyplosphaeria fusca]
MSLAHARAQQGGNSDTCNRLPVHRVQSNPTQRLRLNGNTGLDDCELTGRALSDRQVIGGELDCIVVTMLDGASSIAQRAIPGRGLGVTPHGPGNCDLVAESPEKAIQTSCSPAMPEPAYLRSAISGLPSAKLICLHFVFVCLVVVDNLIDRDKFAAPLTCIFQATSHDRATETCRGDGSREGCRRFGSLARYLFCTVPEKQPLDSRTMITRKTRKRYSRSSARPFWRARQYRTLASSPETTSNRRASQRWPRDHVVRRRRAISRSCALPEFMPQISCVGPVTSVERLGFVRTTNMTGWQSSCSNRLSESNLQLHNAAYSKNDGYFQASLIREEQAVAAEQEMYRRIFGEIDDFSDEDIDLFDGNIALRRAASLEALKLYTGAFASSETPMNRFMTLSPAHDTHPWIARKVMDEAGIGIGDIETLELRQLASEMVDVAEVRDDTREASVGSIRPSSDTLSVSRFKALREAKKEGTRVRKRIGIRRHHVDRKKPPTTTK